MLNKCNNITIGKVTNMQKHNAIMYAINLLSIVIFLDFFDLLSVINYTHGFR